MKRFLTFLKEYTLPLSMLLGVVGFPFFRLLTPCLGTLIFFMLFFTFCKVNPLDLRLHKWHWIMLAFQLVVSVGVFYLLRLYDLVLAQGIMLCFIMPAATAGPIIAGRLGGSIQSLTSFTMLSNVATAVVVPLFFPLANPAADIPFLSASLMILMKVGPLLLGPFFAAWTLRLIYNRVQIRRNTGRTFRLPGTWAQLPFYLWAASLVILMADIMHSLLYDDYDLVIALYQTLGALLACLMQFYVGKMLGTAFPSKPHGEDYKDPVVSDAVDNADYTYQTRISAGQALGQKNTTLGIWMAQTYLNPVSAFAAAAYIVWQNLFNAWQLARAAKGLRG